MLRRYKPVRELASLPAVWLGFVSSGRLGRNVQIVCRTWA